MNPAFSVIFLTTLLGAAQGLFLALFVIEARVAADLLAAPTPGFYVAGSMIAVALLATGLLASFFHLGHPERAWRSAAMWRTSWLSREVIVLPLFMAVVAAYGWAHWQGWQGTLLVGVIGAAVCMLLFLCTAMIYACIKFPMSVTRSNVPLQTPSKSARETPVGASARHPASSRQHSPAMQRARCLMPSCSGLPGSATSLSDCSPCAGDGFDYDSLRRPTIAEKKPFQDGRA